MMIDPSSVFFPEDFVRPLSRLLEFWCAPLVAASWRDSFTSNTGIFMAEDLAPLVYRTALGDQRAFEQLYQQTSSRLYGVALVLLRRRDLAEEVLQEAYIKIWHAAGTYQPERGAVSTWLSTIVRRSAIDRLRRNRNDTLVQQEPEDWDVVDEDTPDPLQQLLEDADGVRLSRCLEHLDERQRESLRLAFFQGLTHSELANRLGTPLGTVKAWIRRGLDKLKGCLHEI